MTILDIFRKDKRYWTHEQREQVQLFFMLTPFFQPYYEHQDFDTVTGFTFYAKVHPSEQLRLAYNKKSEVIILLSGQIELFRQATGKQLKRSRKNKEEILPDHFIKVGIFINKPEVIEVRSDAVVRARGDSLAQFLFVPTILHESYVAMVKKRRVDAVMDRLLKILQVVPIDQLKHLAESSCVIKEYKMNNYIYQAGFPPKACYLVINGNVKVDSPGLDPRKMLEMIIVGENTIFGQKDLNEELRRQNAICCSAHCQVLQIEKQAYNRLVSRNPKLNPSYAQRLKEVQPTKHKSSVQLYTKKFHLPRLQRFNSHVKPEEEDRIQKQIVQNCHMLINISPKKRSSSGFRLPENLDRDYSVNAFDRKMVMFERRKSSNGQLDLSNKLF